MMTERLNFYLVITDAFRFFLIHSQRLLVRSQPGQQQHSWVLVPLNLVQRGPRQLAVMPGKRWVLGSSKLELRMNGVLWHVHFCSICVVAAS